MELKTERNYQIKTAPVVWAVVSPEGVTMKAGFINKEAAEDFRDTAFFGYYKDCDVMIIRKPYLHKASK